MFFFSSGKTHTHRKLKKVPTRAGWIVKIFANTNRRGFIQKTSNFVERSKLISKESHKSKCKMKSDCLLNSRGPTFQIHRGNRKVFLCNFRLCMSNAWHGNNQYGWCYLAHKVHKLTMILFVIFFFCCCCWIHSACGNQKNTVKKELYKIIKKQCKILENYISVVCILS